jgi:EF hand domain-containing protein
MKLAVTLTTVALLCSSIALSQERPSSQSNASTSSTTQAQTPSSTNSAAGSSDIGAVFDQLNVSHNGKLTRKEAQALPGVAEQFDKADTNKDGVLTKKEFLAAFKGK